MFSFQKIRALSILSAVAVAFTLTRAHAQDPTVSDGYLDSFDLNDNRKIDIGALGGGLDTDSQIHKIFVPAQPTSAGPWGPGNRIPSDGRLTGTVHGKLRVTSLADRNGDTFVNGADLDITFDAAWQLIRNTKLPNGASYASSSLSGPEGTPGPNPTTVNFPHTAGGTGAIWNVASCSTAGGIDVNSNPNNREICNQNAPLLNVANLPGGRYTGFVDYTFEISVPGSSDANPGLTISNDNWIITALVGFTSAAQPAGSIAYGRTPTFPASDAVALANGTLFGPNKTLNEPGEQANINVATLLSSVEIVVTPEPGTLFLLAVGGGLTLVRSRRFRRG